MLFWDLLMKAANFGLLGRIEAGRQAAKVLLTLKPDFPSGGAAKPNSTTAIAKRLDHAFMRSLLSQPSFAGSCLATEMSGTISGHGDNTEQETEFCNVYPTELS